MTPGDRNLMGTFSGRVPNFLEGILQVAYWASPNTFISHYLYKGRYQKGEPPLERQCYKLSYSRNWGSLTLAIFYMY